jgi:hypothetical protein
MMSKINCFPILPKKACENLLERLSVLGYFEELWEEDKDDSNIEDKEFLGYTLTQFGYENAKEESFWIGEKGLYNVFIIDSNLINQNIIWIEESQEKFSNLSPTNIPKAITNSAGRVLEIKNQEVLFCDIESSCFKLPKENLKLELHCESTQSLIKLKKGSNIIAEFDEIASLSWTGENVVQQMLENTNEYHYDSANNAIRLFFNESDISFARNINIKYPNFLGVSFDPVLIDNVKVIPCDIREASKWYHEILVKNLTDYFLFDEEFDKYAKKYLEYFKNYFDIKPIRRAELLKENKLNKLFYKKAKLETIDYLSY